MAGHEGHRRIDVAVCHRNAGIGQSGDAGGNSRHHTERHVMPDQHQAFFPAASEDERVAALQPQDPLARLRQFDEPERDIDLLCRRLSAALARVDPRAFRSGQIQDAPVDQRVVDHHIGPAQGVDCMQGQQPRIARARAHQPDPARFEVGKQKIDLLQHGDGAPFR